MTARTEANNTLRVIANQIGIPANQSQPYSLYISWQNGKGKIAYLNADRCERFLFNDRRAGTAQELHFLLLSIDDMPSMVDAIRAELEKNALAFMNKFWAEMTAKYPTHTTEKPRASQFNEEERARFQFLCDIIDALNKNKA